MFYLWRLSPCIMIPTFCRVTVGSYFPGGVLRRDDAEVEVKHAYHNPEKQTPPPTRRLNPTKPLQTQTPLTSRLTA